MANAQNERSMLVEFKEAKKQLISLKEQLKEAQDKFNNAETHLIELLDEQGKDATAKYQNIGWVALSKPRIFASCVIENLPLLFKYLRGRKRGDLIRKTVNSAQLSSFTKELIDNRRKVPPFINYYLKPGLRYFE